LGPPADVQRVTWPSRRLESRTLGKFAPFAGAAWLAWNAVLVGASITWWQYVLSSLLALLAAVLTLLGLTGRLRGWKGVVPGALVFLIAVGLLRNSAGGISSGASALAIIPVFQTALYSRSRRDLVLVLAGVALFYLLPILIVGSPAYPQTQYRAALLAVTVSSIVGLATQRLVANVRFQASEARSHERMLAQVNEAVRGLFDSPQVRVAVCEAVRTTSQADIAVLYEPVPNSDTLWCTTLAGFDAHDAGIVAERGSAVGKAFRSGTATLVTENIQAHVGGLELWTAAGRPASLLYQPLVRGDLVVGVLVVGWPDSVRAEGSRATVAALLAYEAAAAIDRADAMEHLADEALTDVLTGLPNRRAWDAHLTRAVAEHEQWAIAILDFDHFKQYNDTFGHPAGDRLLKETAAGWRDFMRVGDVLARLGGEEFGLLLLDCDPRSAEEVTERLRRRVPRGRTCSAGIAHRRPGETPEVVTVRADQALYQAKAAGRQRSWVSIESQELRPISTDAAG
jgi:diguanylate cyclase (GGDEF)-like protein